VTWLIILSQVVLSFQLPFAVIPLIQFTGSHAKMGEFANSRFTAILAWSVAFVILILNAELIRLTLHLT
jgi:manganese transport protein